MLVCALRHSFMPQPFRLWVTDETAREHAEQFCRAADALIDAIQKLYGEVKIPRSEAAWNG
jgi:hypothetical protein